MSPSWRPQAGGQNPTHFRFLRSHIERLESRDVPSALAAGDEFAVNTYTTNVQNHALVAADSAGRYIVLWESRDQDGDGSGVYAQRYLPDGRPLGSEFQVNATTTGNQGAATVGFDAAGNFIVAWQSFGQDGDREGVYAQRFAADGSRQGEEFPVNTYTTAGQYIPTIGVDAAGNFVIAWTSIAWQGTEGQDGSEGGIFAQRFAADGTRLGSEFRVNDTTAGNQDNPQIGVDAEGNFAVAWSSFGQDGSETGMFGRRFAADGSSLGGEFPVSSYTTSHQRNPGMAMDANGNFLVTWASYGGQDGSGAGVYAQRFDSGGARVGGEFQVNELTAGDQFVSSTAIAANGNFVIVWNSVGQDGSGWGVYGRQYTAAGAPDGGEFQVNSYTTNNQVSPSVGMDPAGNFVVAWMSTGQPGDDVAGIYAQRYDAANNRPTAVAVSHATVPENAGPNRVVGVLSATDLDLDDSFTYRLVAGAGSADNARFNVSGNQLRATGSFDFETRSAYSVRVRATDQGGLTVEAAFIITVTDVNDSPTLGGLATPVEYVENATLILAPTGTASDVDSVDFNTGTLTATLTANAGSNDRLALRHLGDGPGQVGVVGSTVTFGGVTVGTVAGGVGTAPLVVTFNAAASSAAATAVLQNVTYRNVSDNFLLLSRKVALRLTDGDGGTSKTATVTINLQPVNDAPTVSVSGSGTYTEGGPALVVAPVAGLTDPDSPDLDNGSLTITITAGGLATDRLDVRNVGTGAGQVGVNGGTVSYGGVAVGTVTGGTGTDPLVIAFNASATPTAARAVMRAITFANASDDPTVGGSSPGRTIQFAVADGDGGTGTGSKTIVVKGVNDKPLLGGIAATNYAAGAGATAIAGAATVVDPDSGNLAFGKLTVKAVTNGTASDRFEITNQGAGAGQVGIGGGMVSYGGVVVGTFTGGVGTTALVVTFNADSTIEAAQAVLRAVTYRNTNPAPAVTTRTVRYTLGDGDGGLSDAVDQALVIV